MRCQQTEKGARARADEVVTRGRRMLGPRVEWRRRRWRATGWPSAAASPECARAPLLDAAAQPAPVPAPAQPMAAAEAEAAAAAVARSRAARTASSQAAAQAAAAGAAATTPAVAAAVAAAEAEAVVAVAAAAGSRRPAGPVDGTPSAVAAAAVGWWAGCREERHGKGHGRACVRTVCRVVAACPGQAASNTHFAARRGEQHGRGGEEPHCGARHGRCQSDFNR